MKTCCLRSFLFSCAWLACAPLLPTTALALNWSNATAIKAPMTFETAPARDFSCVRFLARGNGYRLYLGQNDFEVALISPGTHGPRPDNTSVQTVRLHASVLGASGPSRPEPVRPSPSVVNSFRGSEPAGWSHGAPTFERIRYREIYPGIDLVFYGNQQSLEYDFIVSPGANPEQIRLSFEGTTGADLENGDLVLHCGAGDFRHHRPVIYQMKNGSRVPVPGEYTLRTGTTAVEVSFKIGSYDRSQPLWIDPVLDYGTFLGGSGNDSGQGITVDSSGNIYVTGQTVSTDFPTTVGAYDSSCGTDGLCNGGHYDVFVTKLNPAGTTKLYSTYFGGSGDEQAWGIAVDSAGRAHVMGWTTSTNFPIMNAFQGALAGSRDAFVSSFNASGQLIYSSYFGGSSDMDADIAGGIALDP
ncbi:MAG TPA: SBBP repeat-containing protein, partial [Verrucomicrobiae bacterium]|nr:SBBP repeat-containing protein [Verrucomicrobiae bacterium]